MTIQTRRLELVPLTCITGAVAEAHYGGVPAHIAGPALAALDDRVRKIVVQFCQRYKIHV